MLITAVFSKHQLGIQRQLYWGAPGAGGLHRASAVHGSDGQGAQARQFIWLRCGSSSSFRMIAVGELVRLLLLVGGALLVGDLFRLLA